VSDIYTGTVNAKGQIVQGLQGAALTLQNEAVPTIQRTQTTDGLGEVFVRDLPAGRYKYRITAGNHQEQTGRLWIKPGITASESMFLQYNLVTVEWQVVEAVHSTA
jgi:large repetitive protein